MSKSNNNFHFKALLIALVQPAIFAPAAFAQGATVNNNALERSRWYTAPREIHVLDERPVVRDFREAPVRPGQTAIPPGPGAIGGPGAGGIGDVGGGTGINPTIPAGGLPIPGGTGPGYRSDPTGMSTLPQSGFGGTNIPARGMGPRGILPGVSTGVVGKIMNQNNHIKQSSAPAKGLSAKGASGGGKASGPPTIASYGNYGNNPNAYGDSLNVQKHVRGYLLRGQK